MATKSGFVGFVLVTVGVVACGGTVSSPNGAPESAVAHASAEAPAVSEILRRMNERYASASTYSDEATMREVMRDADGIEMITTATIRTRWQRPDRLFLELTEKDEFKEDQLAVWSSRGVTKGWFVGKVEDHESIDHALGVYQGVSNGVTALVPRWLLAGGCKCALSYALEPEAACGASRCFVLKSTANGRRVTLMVDRETYALRRYHTVYTVTPDPKRNTAEMYTYVPEEERARFLEKISRPFDVDQTIDYTPVFDPPLAATAFEFNPPSSTRESSTARP